MRYNSLRWDVIWLITETGAGPIPSTVVEPGATCVRPLATESEDGGTRSGRTHPEWIERRYPAISPSPGG